MARCVVVLPGPGTERGIHRCSKSDPSLTSRWMAALYSTLLPVTIALLPITDQIMNAIGSCRSSIRAFRVAVRIRDGQSSRRVFHTNGYILAEFENIETRGREESLTP